MRTKNEIKAAVDAQFRKIITQTTSPSTTASHLADAIIDELHTEMQVLEDLIKMLENRLNS